MTRTIPEELLEDENWAMIQPDYDWIWTVEHQGKTVGFLMAAGGHGIAFILRLKMTAGAPHHCLLRLLRTFLDDVAERNCTVYMSWLNVSRTEEADLVRIVTRAGGYSMDMTHVLCAGSVEEARRF